jgi:hypothetical protein
MKRHEGCTTVNEVLYVIMIISNERDAFVTYDHEKMTNTFDTKIHNFYLVKITFTSYYATIHNYSIITQMFLDLLYL